jgi:Domain of unknown function (DUF4386)
MDSTSTKRTARLAGLLYLISSLPAPFALIYVPSKVFVEGDPAATAERLRNFEALLRAGIAAGLASGILFIFVPLVLYRLFRPVSEWAALAMLILILISFPISFEGVVHQIAALNLAGGGEQAGTLSALGTAQRDALAYFELRQHYRTMMVAEIFWGLWLFPFGICVMRSRFIPRILGILLLIAGAGYVLDAFAELAATQFVPLTDKLTTFTHFCEVPIIFWLLIWGAKPQVKEGQS